MDKIIQCKCGKYSKIKYCEVETKYNNLSDFLTINIHCTHCKEIVLFKMVDIEEFKKIN